MDLSTAAQIVLVLFAVASWRRGQNPKLANRTRIFNAVCSAYYVLAAATIFLSRISLALAAKSSSIAAAVLLAFGVFGKSASKDPDPYDPNVHLDGPTARFPAKDFDWWWRSEQWELKRLLALDTILLAIALGLTSIVVWAILFLHQG
jgi:hypothetical protein